MNADSQGKKRLNSLLGWRSAFSRFLGFLMKSNLQFKVEENFYGVRITAENGLIDIMLEYPTYKSKRYHKVKKLVDLFAIALNLERKEVCLLVRAPFRKNIAPKDLRGWEEDIDELIKELKKHIRERKSRAS